MSSFRTLQYNRIWMMLHLLPVLFLTHYIELKSSEATFPIYSVFYIYQIYTRKSSILHTHVYIFTPFTHIIIAFMYHVHVRIVWKKKCNIDSDSSACVVLVLFWDHFVCSRPVLYMILQPWKSRFLNTFLKWNNMTVCNGYLLLNCMVY